VELCTCQRDALPWGGSLLLLSLEALLAGCTGLFRVMSVADWDYTVTVGARGWYLMAKVLFCMLIVVKLSVVHS
jgi:hypothetical protein